jgi:hypothetical protein
VQSDCHDETKVQNQKSNQRLLFPPKRAKLDADIALCQSPFVSFSHLSCVSVYRMANFLFYFAAVRWLLQGKGMKLATPS